MTTDDAKEVAGRLTAAQRRMTLTDDRYFAAHAKGHWSGSNIRTAKVLFDYGMIHECDTLSPPTAFGRAVRAALDPQS